MNYRLKKERRKIDKIDKQIFNLIKKRTIVVKKMLSKKWGRILNCSGVGVKFGGGKNTFNYSFSF